MNPNVTIFSTPFYCSKTPLLAPPLLKAYLKANNVDCEYVDLSIRFNNYMLNNLNYLSINLEQKLTEFLEKEEFNEENLHFFHKSLQLFPLVSFEFLEKRFHKNILFLDKNNRKASLCKVEDLIHYQLLWELNKFKSTCLKICESPNELKNYINSGIYNGFYLSENIFSVIKQAIKSNIIAISVTFEDQLLAALVLAYEIKKIKRDTFIIIGGSTITRSCLDSRFSEQLLKNDFGINAIGLYEGEKTLTELAFCIIRQGDVKQVPNLLIYDEIAERVVATSIAPPPHLDELPTPEYNPEDIDLYWRFANKEYDYLNLDVLVSRGCHWGKCSFCDENDNFNPNGTFMFRSIEKIVNDIETLQNKYRASHFSLITSAMPPNLAKVFSNMIIEKGITAKFWSYFKCGNEQNMDHEFFYLLKKAGFNRVNLGVESFINSALSLCNKGTTQKDNIYTLSSFGKVGIKVKLNIIFDLPPITKKDFFNNIEVIKKYAKFIHRLEMYPLMLLSHSDLGKNPNAFGVECKHNNGNQFVNTGPPRFIIKEFENPLYKEMPRKNVYEFVEDVFKHNLFVWNEELLNKITSIDFSFKKSFFSIKPFFIVKFPFSYRYYGKKETVFYVFLEGFASWFEIPEYFTDLIDLMYKSIQQTIAVSDFLDVFKKGCQKAGYIKNEEIEEKFKCFIVEFVLYGFVKEIINEYSLELQGQDISLIKHISDNNRIAEFHRPFIIPNFL